MSQLNIRDLYELDEEGKKTIVVKHFPPNIDGEHLQAYLELVFGVEHLTLVLPHPGCSVAVASLDGDISVSDKCLVTYQGNVFSNPIKRDCFPELAMLGSPAGVYLEEVSEIVDSSDIMSYFEGFASVDNVQRVIDGNLQCFAVTILDMCAVHSLISKEECCVCGHSICIQPYYPAVHDPILEYMHREADKDSEIEASELCPPKEATEEVIQPENQPEDHLEMISDANVLQANAVQDDTSDNTGNSSPNQHLAKSTPSFHSLTIIDEHSDTEIPKKPMTMYVGPSFIKSVENPFDNNGIGSWSQVSSPKYHHNPNIATVKPFCVRATGRDNDSGNEHDTEEEMTSGFTISKADQSWFDDEDSKETISMKFEQQEDEIDTDDELKGAIGGVDSEEETGDYFKQIPDERPVSRYGRKRHRLDRWQGGCDEQSALKQALLRSMQDGGVHESHNPRPERQSQTAEVLRKQNTQTRVKPRTRSEQVNGVAVYIVKEEIAKHSADVLVNVVNSSDQDPFNTMVAKSFLKVGGQGLLQEFQMAQKSGTSQTPVITSTRSTGALRSRTVLHVTIERDSDCKQVVDAAMVQLLDVCTNSRSKSVAIPPIGIGRMFKFPTPLVAERMLKQVYRYIESHKHISLKEITIVIYDDDTFDTFNQALTAIANKDRTHLRRNQQPQRKPSHGHSMSHVQQQSSQPPRHSHSDRRSQDNDRNHAYSVQRNNVKGGTSEKTTRTKADVRPTYIQKMASADPEVPKYWNNYKPDTSITQLLVEPIKHFFGNKHEKVELKTDTPEYREIIKMINKTFDPQKVGHGIDATGIPQGSYRRLNVLKIERVENLELYEKFASRRRACYRILLKSKTDTYPAIKDLPNCKGDPVTSSFCQGVLGRDMHSKINEYLFFHGTKRGKSGAIGVVCNNGFEPKLGNQGAMLGQGIYGAEQSTKADQYTDCKDTRSYGQGNKKKMFLVRMILGNSYVSSDANPHKYKQPPCTKCYKDDCKNADHGKGKFGHFFHSVIGENGKLFREFVVYDSDLCYPEYLISYERL